MNILGPQTMDEMEESKVNNLRKLRLGALQLQIFNASSEALERIYAFQQAELAGKTATYYAKSEKDFHEKEDSGMTDREKMLHRKKLAYYAKHQAECDRKKVSYYANREEICHRKRLAYHANREAECARRKKAYHADREKERHCKNISYMANREKILQRRRIAYHANREAECERKKKAYYAKHEKELIEKRESYMNNREKILHRRKLAYHANRQAECERKKKAYYARRERELLAKEEANMNNRERILHRKKVAYYANLRAECERKKAYHSSCEDVLHHMKLTNCAKRNYNESATSSDGASSSQHENAPLQPTISSNMKSLPAPMQKMEPSHDWPMNSEIGNKEEFLLLPGNANPKYFHVNFPTSSVNPLKSWSNNHHPLSSVNMEPTDVFSRVPEFTKLLLPAFNTGQPGGWEVMSPCDILDRSDCHSDFKPNFIGSHDGQKFTQVLLSTYKATTEDRNHTFPNTAVEPYTANSQSHVHSSSIKLEPNSMSVYDPDSITVLESAPRLVNCSLPLTGANTITCAFLGCKKTSSVFTHETCS